ncbi:MAG: ATP-binding cassette domain-containing protein [Lachnospiraceae bacterium]|nr:ATP-binding cassette domain-containing protein [Lachnospiraceae bacterium]
MNDREIVLSGKELHKSFGPKENRRHILKGVSFELYSGEILGIVGESGSGKSTLLKLICGIEKPDSGELIHRGKEYTGIGPEKTGKFLQMIFQDAYGSFDPRMSMEKSLKEGVGVSEEEMVKVIEEVGLTKDLLSRRPRHLSGGQCQRMSVARALLGQADILMCDEVTSALDVTSQAQVVKMIEDVRNKEDVSILFVSHDLALVSNLCDRVMVIKEGEVVDYGETKTVINNPTSEYTKKLLDSVIDI